MVECLLISMSVILVRGCNSSISVIVNFTDAGSDRPTALLEVDPQEIEKGIFTQRLGAPQCKEITTTSQMPDRIGRRF